MSEVVVGTISVTPPVQPKPDTLYILHEENAKIQYMHGGHVLKSGLTYTDYGKMTCIESAIESAKGAMELYQITPESSLEIIVCHFIRRRECEKIYHEPEYGEKYKSIRSQVVQITSKIWSSKEPEVIHPAKPAIRCPMCGSLNGGIMWVWGTKTQDDNHQWYCPDCDFESIPFQYTEEVINFMNGEVLA